MLIGQIDASTTIRDSQPASFHTSAAASVSSDDFLQFTVPSLLPGERFLMDLVLIASANNFTTLFAGSLSVDDVTSGSLLASFDQSGPGSTVLDLSGLAGHDVRVSLAAELAMSGAAGFGGGVDSLTKRTFISHVIASFRLSHVVVPEPAPAVLISAGLAALGMRRRRRNRS